VSPSTNRLGQRHCRFPASGSSSSTSSAGSDAFLARPKFEPSIINPTTFFWRLLLGVDMVGYVPAPFCFVFPPEQVVTTSDHLSRKLIGDHIHHLQWQIEPQREVECSPVLITLRTCLKESPGDGVAYESYDSQLLSRVSR
jgi:hypothetical protein